MHAMSRTYAAGSFSRARRIAAGAMVLEVGREVGQNPL
jgi:hypothetical protein